MVVPSTGGALVILVHRLHGEALFLNADLIETVEALPDTIVTLVDGRRVLVREEPEEVVALFARFRASVIVAVDELRATERPALRVLPGVEA
jgi:flagellar protein FlbD